MQPVDNSHLTEEQRTELFRQSAMLQLGRQTRALETIRTILLVFTILFVIAAIAWVATYQSGT